MYSLPKDIRFSDMKPMGVNSKPQILRYRAEGGPAFAGDTMRFEIPTGLDGQMLFPKSSFIEGKLLISGVTSAAAAGTISIDQSVYSLFNRMRITHGSIVVEDIERCNRVWTALYDLQVNASERAGSSIHMLIDDDDPTSGVTIGTTSAGGVTTGVLVDFCFQLPSALLGSLATKCLPLGEMDASALYLELELATPETAFVFSSANYTGAGTYAISECHFNAKVSTLDNAVNSELRAMNKNSISLPAIAYKTDIKSLAAGSSLCAEKFGFQFSSLKTFMFMFQNSGAAVSRVSRAVSSRPKSTCISYQLTINGESYPSALIQNTGRMYCELLRSFDSLSDTNAGGILTSANYTVDTQTIASDTTVKRFLAGIDLDRFNHSSDLILSGTNTIGQQVNLIANFGTATTDNLNVLGIAMYDIIYKIVDGQMTFVN